MSQRPVGDRAGDQLRPATRQIRPTRRGHAPAGARARCRSRRGRRGRFGTRTGVAAGRSTLASTRRARMRFEHRPGRRVGGKLSDHPCRIVFEQVGHAVHDLGALEIAAAAASGTSRAVPRPTVTTRTPVTIEVAHDPPRLESHRAGDGGAADQRDGDRVHGRGQRAEPGVDDARGHEQLKRVGWDAKQVEQERHRGVEAAEERQSPVIASRGYSVTRHRRAGEPAGEQNEAQRQQLPGVREIERGGHQDIRQRLRSIVGCVILAPAAPCTTRSGSGGR